jgi:hypothetical protein
MNDLYNETITRKGKTYHYDPDHDIYYCRYGSSDMSHFDQYAWIYLIIMLTGIVWALS